jgi:hypothetical protein
LNFRIARLVFVTFAVCALSQAASLVVPPGLIGLVPNDGNASPFGAGDVGGVYITGFQQIFDSSYFSGPITIAGLEFYNTQFVDPNYNTINDSVYTVNLYTTSLNIYQLDPTALANNLFFTSNPGTLFSGELSGTVNNGVFDIVPADPSFYYNYDPSQGNLLLYITKTGNTNGPSLFLDYASDQATQTVLMSSATEFSSTFDPSDPSASLTVNVTPNTGLVTGFLNPNDLLTPEPGTFVPFVLGILALVRLRRRVR